MKGEGFHVDKSKQKGTPVYTMDGKTQTLAAWCREYGVSYRAVYKYIGEGKTLVGALKRAAEEKRIKNSRCKECEYGERLDGTIFYCAYILQGKGRRPCPPDKCTVFEPKSGKTAKRWKLERGVL